MLSSFAWSAVAYNSISLVRPPKKRLALPGMVPGLSRRQRHEYRPIRFLGWSTRTPIAPRGSSRLGEWTGVIV